jgi:tungstate transport system ATP-binding protein
MKPLIEAKNIEYSYGEGFKLDIPSLKIDDHSSTGLVGNNGSGKSTLMDILCGIKKPNHGEILLSNELKDGDITILLQNPYLLKRSVFENLVYPLRISNPKLKKSDLLSRAENILDKMALHRSFLKRKWNQLSGGEAQRVALGSRLIMNPRVMILDEPTTYIDGESAAIIKEVITSFYEDKKMTFIIASHDSIWLNSLCNNIYKMNKGHIIGKGNDNVIPGPWIKNQDGLYVSKINGNCEIYGAHVLNEIDHGLLSANDIMLSEVYPEQMSAQNIIEGTIAVLSPAMDSNINVTLDCGSMYLNVEITDTSARQMKLLPGQKVFGVFKATSIQFY